MHRVFWVGSSLVLPGLLFLICTPSLKEVLGAETFGAFALLYTSFQVASMLDFGATKTLSYYVAGGSGRNRFWQVACYIVATIAIGFFVLWPVFHFLSTDNTLYVSPEPVALALVTALYAGCQLCKSVLDASGQFALGFVSRILLALIVVVLPILLPPGFDLTRIIEGIYPATLFGLLLLNGLGLALALGTSRVVGHPSSASPLFRPLIHYQFFAFLAAVMIVASNYGERFILTSYVTLTELGGYVVAAELLLKILLPSTIFSTMLLIDLRRSTQVSDNLRILKRAIVLCALTTGLLCLAIYTFSGFILFTWLKTEIAWNDTYFLAMIVGVFLNAMAAVLSTCLEASGRQGLRFTIFVIYVPVHLIALTWLIPSLGVEGAALGWLLKGALEVVMFGAAVRWLFKFVK